MSKARGTRRDPIASAPQVQRDEVTPSSGNSSSQRWERLALGLLCLVAIAVRTAQMSDLAVEHFDEGVYASNLWFGAEQGFQYPLRYLYAPPLLPAAIEWLLIFGGSLQTAPFWPSLVAGCATIPLIWFAARFWFGPRTAFVAAALATASDVHTLFTRSVLTDALLLAFTIGAVACGARALRSGRFAWIAAAGILAGLAWWTKYNGWLPLAILGAGLTLHGLVDRWTWEAWQRQILRWLAIVLIALIVWSPVWYGLQSYGGYGVVAANHRKYVVGPLGWLPSFVVLASQLRASESWLGVFVAPLLASFLWCVPNLSRPGQRQCGAILGGVLTFAAIGMALGSSAALLMVALLGIAMFLRRAIRPTPRRDEAEHRNDEDQDQVTQGRAMTTAWVAGLLLATPCYYPYLRLTLPCIAGLWLTFAWAVVWAFERMGVRQTDGDGKPASGSAWQLRFGGSAILTCIGAALALFVAAGVYVGSSPDRQRQLAAPAFLESRRGIANATRFLIEGRPTLASATRTPSVFYVYGEPAVVYHLRALGEELVMPVADLNFPATSAESAAELYLVVGPHAAVDQQFADDWKRLGARFERVEGVQFTPSAVLWFDQDAARLSFDARQVKKFELKLYRVRNG